MAYTPPPDGYDFITAAAQQCTKGSRGGEVDVGHAAYVNCLKKWAFGAGDEGPELAPGRPSPAPALSHPEHYVGERKKKCASGVACSVELDFTPRGAVLRKCARGSVKRTVAVETPKDALVVGRRQCPRRKK